MPKNVLQDMVKTQKREPSVFFSELAKATNKNLSTLEEKPVTQKPIEQRVPPPKQPVPPVHRHLQFEPVNHHMRMWVIAGGALLVLLFALSFIFAGARVSVTPKTALLDLKTTIDAERDAIMPTFPFQLMAIQAEESTVVSSTSSKEADSKAVGKVILFNEYSSTPQNLLINTRLEAPNGNIYYTDIAPKIPGYTMKGTELIPGSVEVSVTAAEAGETYNSPLTDFTIIGFKSQPDKYEKMYGRSKTEMTGGADGVVYTISEESAIAAYNESAEALKKTLDERIHNELPEGFILFNDLLFITVDESKPITESSSQDIAVVAKGSAEAFIFKRDEIEEAIARAMIAEYNGLPVAIPDLENLQLTLVNKSTIIPATVTSISLNIEGVAHAVWDIDTETIKSELLGKRKRVFQEIMASHEAVESAEVVIQPFWERSFPKKGSAITVEIINPSF